MKSVKIWTRLSLVSAIAIASALTVAVPEPASAGQSCEARGSWTASLNLPDLYRAPSSHSDRAARFVRACRELDDCYNQAGSDKDRCDLAFFEQLEDECVRAYGRTAALTNPALSECDRAADEIYEVVSRSRASQRAYLQAQESQQRRWEEQVSRLYREMLDRRPSLRVTRDYVEALERGWSLDRVREDIAYSRDAEDAIEEIYEDVLDREPDRRGMDTYQRALARGWDLEKVREDIAYSDEAERAINRIYREVLGRNADRSGLRTYRKALARGRSLRDIRRDIENSDEARRRRPR
ncbi:DUF4214 domain-containing protein [Oxynema aestuarii]|uniref:DUF4214 domain-containing protein n=1 Tax=Oxynema aestuarii AP17 TaxID=2064643 RepID=A0A6H1TXD1_9CYAN|nr:DUF4214 domain-containing protein [Oxynema aestuarii]QIZ70866.1 DUF4214 domain-containing protein [Oxynema aestuarii AP17]RMH72160.1 MAG: DUF4214 domain-containing protein [Cyanobacteria bacterium J007]